MLLIDNDVVRRVLRMEDCIGVQEAAFGDLLSGRSIHRPRIDVYAPAERADGFVALFRRDVADEIEHGADAVDGRVGASAADIVLPPRFDDRDDRDMRAE